MYVPQHFREERGEVLRGAARDIGFGTLITHGPGGIEANHLPMLLEGDRLCGHFARANPVWKSLDVDAEGLAIFLGPHAYISPSLYPTKRETGKAVPTWNYITVHARGRIRLFEDPERLRAHVAALSAFHESRRAEPWEMNDAPASYIDGLLRAIVGFEFTITRLEGKWKLSQNRPVDVAAVRDAMAREEHGLAKYMET